VASSAEEALALLSRAAEEKKPFNIALIDLVMPEMDGIALCKRIKNDPLLKDTDCILMTCRTMSCDEKRSQEAGFSAYLTKPVKKSQLLYALHNANNPNFLAAPDKAEEKTVGMSPPLRSSNGRKSILVAEDNAINQKVVMHILNKFGYKALAAGNGKEVLDCLSRNTYDLILMDIQMPEMDGLEATRTIRESDKTYNQIPIIAMTANAMKGDDDKCIEAGMDDYISKPIDAGTVKQKIDQWIGREHFRTPKTAF
jgi:two-component system sensor histidine kinase/response regulator